MEDPHATPLLRLTKGAHVMVRRERLGHDAAITLTSPIDGRVMFVLPWGDYSYIGTTDTDTAEGPDDVRTSTDDVHYLLRSANAAFPNAHLGERDVVASWAGLRPLVRPDQTVGASQVPREHVIVQGPGGMLTIAGGKLTTFRVMAAEMVDRVVAILHQLDGRPRARRPPTDREPLPGGEVRDLAPLESAGLELGLFRETVEHIADTYGTECSAVFNLVRERRELAAQLVPGYPAIEAEVVHVARRELAQRVEDVLVRRIHPYYETGDHGLAGARRTAELLGEELGWDGRRIGEEAARYVEFVRSQISGERRS
jgi:glycerol-3-phosphate dehydrogenase